VSGAGNDDQFHRNALFEICNEFPQILGVAKLIVFSVDQEQGFTARREKTEVILLERRPDANQVRDTWIIYANIQPDSRPERKSTEQDPQPGVLFRQIVQGRPRIVLLSTSFVVFTGALADAAKVKSQGCQAGIIQSRGGTKYHLIVHRAATERMWM
jgi:hypothetical protein